MTKEKFKALCKESKLTLKDLKSMTVKQRIEMRKNANRYVVDANKNGSADFLGAFIREVVNSKGEILCQ